jgi:FkbM family methyltransferase
MHTPPSADAMKMRKYKQRLSLVETVALCVVVVVVTVMVQRWRWQPHFYYSAEGLTELESLKKYGLTNHASLNFEELIARDFFNDRRNGTFLDVGANHYQRGNNTYFLETSLDWSGIAIEPLEEFRSGYVEHRPRTRFVAMFASDVPDSTVQLFVPKDTMSSSSDADSTVRNGKPGAARAVPTTTLTHVLDQAGLTHVDFVSLDIELAEPKALAGFDIDRFKPALVCIESHPKVRQQILDYFARHQYTVVGKYLRIDPQNLYFTPLTHAEGRLKDE